MASDPHDRARKAQADVARGQAEPMAWKREKACRTGETSDNQRAEAHGGRGQGHPGNPGSAAVRNSTCP